MRRARIRYVNVCYHVAKRHWQVDMVSSDDTIWTLQTYPGRADAIDRALEFAEFAGVPAKVHGIPITALNLETTEGVQDE